MGDPKMATQDYQLDEQVGYLMRLANQRHTGIFQSLVGHDLTPMQFSALSRISEQGAVSQNKLGRLAAMDVATVKGVVDRLRTKNLITSRADPKDARRSLISLTDVGEDLIDKLKISGSKITAETLAPLDASEQGLFLKLLKKLT